MNTVAKEELFEAVCEYPLREDPEAELAAIASGERYLFVVEVPRDRFGDDFFVSICEKAFAHGLCTTMFSVAVTRDPVIEQLYVFVSRRDQLWRVSAYLDARSSVMNGQHSGMEIEAHLRGFSSDDVDRAARWSENIGVGDHVVIVTDKSLCADLVERQRRQLPPDMEGQIALVPRPYLLKSVSAVESLEIGVIRCRIAATTIEAMFPDHKSRKDVDMRDLTTTDIRSINDDVSVRIEVLTLRGWL